MHVVQTEAAEHRVVLLDRSREGDWDAYIMQAPLAVFSHQRGWGAVAHDTFGHEAVHLMAYRSGRVVGVLPLVIIKSRLFGRVVVSSPYLTHGGILADDAAAADALVARAVTLTQQCGAHYLELRNPAPAPAPGTAPLQSKTKYHTLVLDLSPGPDALWKDALHATARRNVRKAQKNNVEVIQGHEHLETFVEINTRNMRRLGTPAHGIRFFRNILRHFPDAMLLMARVDQQFIAGMLLVGFRDTIQMPWVASLEEHAQHRPSNLLYWEAIAAACRNGYHYFDFGRSKEESGTWRFKMQHGAQPVQVVYQYHLNRIRNVPDIDPDNKSFQHLIAAWRRLPMPFVRSVGPRLIAAIP